MHHSHLFTLTCARDENDQLWGEWRRVWHAVEQRYGRQRYFAWMELTARGRIHYHVAWLNAPWVVDETPAEWLERLWGHGHVEQNFRGASRSLSSLANYVRGYVKKAGSKAYQQDYAEAPVGMRTFASERLGIPGELLDTHLDRWEALYVDGHVELTGRVEHIPGRFCGPSAEQREWAARRGRYREGRRLARIWTQLSPVPIRKEERERSVAAVARVLQEELFSEYWEWHARVYCLAW